MEIGSEEARAVWYPASHGGGGPGEWGGEGAVNGVHGAEGSHGKETSPEVSAGFGNRGVLGDLDQKPDRSYGRADRRKGLGERAWEGL